MSTYSGVCFFVPTFLSFVAFMVWMIVMGRMTNLNFPLYKRVLVFGWSLAMIALGVMDLNNDHSFANLTVSGREVSSDYRVVLVILLKTVIRVGIISMGVVYYRDLGKSHPGKMAFSPFEKDPTPSGAVAVLEAEKVATKVAAKVKMDILSATDTVSQAQAREE